ncbi:MAG: SPOR domain-containing protein [Treponema sp.]|jgi:tetratricopeptide (TPR) repeat protein|nr:SPOR domain-containing protein [Treponema sp.]
MGSIDRSFVFSLAAAFLLAASLPAYGEQAGAGAEIQNLKKTAERPGAPAVEKHDALVRLARLYELLGDFEAAAETWLGAASAEPGKLDDASLVRGGRCFAAMGEWEKAEAAIAPVLLSSRDGGVCLDARYLGARIAAFRSGDTSVLCSLLEDPGFSEMKPAIYYTLWRLTGSETWKAPLLSEYSRSPEGRIAAGGSAVDMKPSALWLLPAGLDPVFPGGAKPSSAAGTPGIQAAVPDARAAAPAAGKALQTGLFGRETNAAAMRDRLRAAGFSPVMARRTVKGQEYWAVYVPAGNDVNGAIGRLKSAGFDAFPVDVSVFAEL